MESAGSDFASVVRITERLGPWPKLGGDECLSRLHTKFWGKSMQVEELEWKNSQPPIPAVGDELGSEDQRMHVDFDVSDVGDDVIPGCYVLNIGIRGLERSKIWIRADYIRVYNFLETIDDGTSMAEDVAPGAIITGQPGIGKSVWVYYALRRRLAEMKPVMWYRGGTRYLFVAEGVYQAPRCYDSTHFHKFVWTLVDSDEAIDAVPSRLVPHGTRLFVIYTTSPHKERWHRLHKTVSSFRVIMNPWTRTEISYAASICGITDHEGINEVYDQFGPTPRLCIDFFYTALHLQQYKTDVRNVVSNITLDELERLFRDASSLTLDAISHKICLISREDRKDVASDPVVTPITSFIQTRLATQIRKLERQDQIRLYKRFAKVPDSRGLAGILFEAAAQSSLGDGMKLELIPMVHLPQSQTNPQPRWYSSHSLLRNDTLEVSRQKAFKESVPIHVMPSRVLEYMDDGPKSIESGVFYVPELTNQVALDSFILLNGVLHVFQFTVGKTHDIKPGPVDFTKKTHLNLPSMDRWRFVFIIPHNLTLICPQSRSLELRKLQLYSAVANLS